MKVDEIITFDDVKKMLGVGRVMAEYYINESGAALPRKKGAPYRVRKSKLLEWLNAV